MVDVYCSNGIYVKYEYEFLWFPRLLGYGPRTDYSQFKWLERVPIASHWNANLDTWNMEYMDFWDNEADYLLHFKIHENKSYKTYR